MVFGIFGDHFVVLLGFLTMSNSTICALPDKLSLPSKQLKLTFRFKNSKFVAMKYAEVIHDAWEMTQESSKLKWFVFVPSVAVVILFIIEITWQMFWLSEEFGLFHSDFSLSMIGNFFSFLSSHHLLLWIILLIIFVIFFAFFMPAWVSATMLLGIRHQFETPEKYFSIRQKIVSGFEYFFHLFEFNALMAPFQFLTISFFVVTMYRFYHGDIFDLMLPVIIVYSIFSFVINLFLSFCPYFIVYEGMPVGIAIKKSIALVFLNFSRTFAVLMLMLFVNLRVILNVIVVLGVPFGILFSISYFTNFFAIFVAVILGISAILFAAYLTAIVEVFATAVWERTFTTLREQQDELEGIETPKNIKNVEN